VSPRHIPPPRRPPPRPGSPPRPAPVPTPGGLRKRTRWHPGYLIAASLPGVPVAADDLAGDYLPSDPDPAGLPPGYARFVAGFPAAERAEGPQRADAALDRFARPGGADGDEYELVVTHNFLVGWLVSQAMAAPPWRWLGMNQMNCAISVIAYQPDLPASLLTFNDAGHLSPELRWTGFPPTLRPEVPSTRRGE
jgi:serine/threonine-protein phosphatase PGAM5